MGEITLSGPERGLRSWIQRYNHDKYWRYRSILVDPKRGASVWNLWRLLYIKRADAFNNASLGTHRGFGASFAAPPHLPHGLYGIVLSHNAVVGRNCTIYHQVTIGQGRGGAPVIGDDVVIGAGAKIIGGIRIGNGAKIGAGCVVSCDVPDGATVVMEKPRILLKQEVNHGG